MKRRLSIGALFVTALALLVAVVAIPAWAQGGGPG
jgi:hypothetical protein